MELIHQLQWGVLLIIIGVLLLHYFRCIEIPQIKIKKKKKLVPPSLPPVTDLSDILKIE